MHKTWIKIMHWIDERVERFDGVVRDQDGNTLDWGQALCREVYGPDWMNSHAFKKAEEISAHDPAPKETLDVIDAWDDENLPDWMVV